MTTKYKKHHNFFYKSALIALLSIITSNTSLAQKWYPGRFTDVNGAKSTGYVRPTPNGNGPFANEAFIEFKDEENSTPYYLSARDLQSFIVGVDSFVVAHAPGNETWAKREFDFVKVAVDEPTKIYSTWGAGGDSGGKKVQVSPELGIGTGTYGSYYGGGVGISIGGNGNYSNKLSYYYGSNTANMRHLTNENFIDIMSEVMADEPEVVQQIRNKQFNLKSIEKLIAYFNKVKATQ